MIEVCVVTDLQLHTFRFHQKMFWNLCRQGNVSLPLITVLHDALVPYKI